MKTTNYYFNYDQDTSFDYDTSCQEPTQLSANWRQIDLSQPI